MDFRAAQDQGGLGFSEMAKEGGSSVSLCGSEKT